MVKSFEGLRGWAALCVALYHLELGFNYLPFIRNGYLFVDLFFVLSGFVISAAYADRLDSNRNLGSFVIRRFGRLFPLLVLSTVLFVLTQHAIPLINAKLMDYDLAGLILNPDISARPWPTVLEIVTTLTFTHALGMHEALILNYVSWSISVEFWAYILFALLSRLVPKQPRFGVFAVISTVAFFVTLWASAIYHHCLTAGKCLDLTYDFSFARCVFSFLLGVLVLNFRDVGRRFEGLVQVGSVVILLVLFSLVTEFRLLAFICPFVFALLVWSLSRDTGLVARLLSGKIGQALGERSYSIYMLHPVLLVLGFYHAALRVQSHWLAPVLIVVYVGVLLLCSGWTYRLVELPLRNLFNSLADRLNVKPQLFGSARPRPSVSR